MMNARHQTISKIVSNMAQVAPDKKAFYLRDNQGLWVGMSWLEFDKAVTLYASHLRHKGIRKGDRLGIMAPSSLQWQITEIAAWRCGAIVVAIDPHIQPTDFQHILSNLQISALVVDCVKQIHNFPESIRRNRTWLDFEELALDTHEQFQYPNETGNLSDPALMIFTSGTTGEAKTISYTHAQLLAGSHAICNALPLSAKDVMLCWLPMNHLFQQIVNILGITTGMTIYFHEDPKTIMKAIKQVRPTFFIGVPRFYEKIHQNVTSNIDSLPKRLKALTKFAIQTTTRYKRLKQKGAAISLPKRLVSSLADYFIVRKIRETFGDRIRFLITGSAPMPLNTLKFFNDMDLCLLEAYGLSENTIPVAINRPDNVCLGSVGKPTKGNVIRIENDGEILVKGPGLFDGYVERSKRNLFTADGFYRTGDVGYMDHDGHLHLTGRKSEIIKTSTGRRIAPVRIESTIRSSPLVDQVMVVGHAKKYLTALIVATEPHIHKRTIQAEIKRLNLTLPTYEQIRKFKIIRQPFSVQGGEFTPSLKMKRHVIEGKYCKEIESMYPATPVAELLLQE